MRCGSWKGRGVVLLCLVCVLAVPGSGLAQSRPDTRWSRATWVDDFNFLAANALVAAVTGGVLARLHGRSFADGFTRGALGGGVVYLGKRTAVAGFSGAGLLGREVGALGASITRSAAYGSGMLDTLVLPVGPLRVHLTPRDPGGSALRVDLEEVYWLVYGLAEDRLDLDVGRSLSAGTAVFTSASRFKGRDGNVDGQAGGGMIVLSRNPRWDAPARIFAHERVHILQYDFLKITAGEPLERWALGRLHAANLPLVSHVDPGVGYMLPWYLLSGIWSDENNPLQFEAEFLEGR